MSQQMLSSLNSILVILTLCCWLCNSEPKSASSFYKSLPAATRHNVQVFSKNSSLYCNNVQVFSKNSSLYCNIGQFLNQASDDSIGVIHTWIVLLSLKPIWCEMCLFMCVCVYVCLYVCARACVCVKLT